MRRNSTMGMPLGAMLLVCLAAMQWSSAEVSAADPDPTATVRLARVELMEISGSSHGYWPALAFHVRAFDYPQEDLSGTWTVGPLTSADRGRSFLATPSSGEYPLLEFHAIAALLTNGQDDVLELTVGPFPTGGGSIAMFESTLFTGESDDLWGDAFVPLRSGFDLWGYRVEALRITVRDILIAYDPATDFTSYRGAFTVDIFGAFEQRPLAVDLDVRPGNPHNVISRASNGSIQVAVLSTPSFDAARIDPATLRLAGTGVRILRATGRPCRMRDVNGDRLDDLVCHVAVRALMSGIVEPVITLVGETSDGLGIRGEAPIRVVPRR